MSDFYPRGYFYPRGKRDTPYQRYKRIVKILMGAPFPLGAEEIYDADHSLGSAGLVGWVIGHQNGGEVILNKRPGKYPLYQAFWWEPHTKITKSGHYVHFGVGCENK
jgi:hypothetical protein